MTGQAVIRRCDLDSMRAAELTFDRALGPPLTPASFASLRPLRFDRAGLFGAWSSSTVGRWRHPKTQWWL